MLMPLNYINTGKDGVLTGTTTADVDKTFDAIAGRPRIALHFHGGLVSRASGLDIAGRLWPDYDRAGSFPIFFIWESGLLDIVPRNLTEIFGEDVFKILLKRVLQFAMGKLVQVPGSRGIAGLTPTDISVEKEIRKRLDGTEPYATVKPVAVEALAPEEEAEFSTALAEDPDFGATVEAIAAGVFPGGEIAGSRGLSQRSSRTLMSPDVVDELANDVQTTAAAGGRGLFTTAKLVARAVRILARVIARFRQHRDHGLYPTAIEEILRELYVANIGANIWAAMKQETADSFGAMAGRGGTYFLDKLAVHLTALGPGAYPEITLVGHSTGAVFIDHLLAAVQARQLAGTFPADFAFRQVVFLAPANTMTKFANTIATCGGLFRAMRIFGMQDDVEAQDAMVPFVYPRSLLYFVSGLLETDAGGTAVVDMPLVGMERYYTLTEVYADDATKSVRAFTKGRQVWSVASGAAGLCSESRRHGDFDNDRTTRDSLIAIVSQGIAIA
jgi:hypothetical protein